MKTSGKFCRIMIYRVTMNRYTELISFTFHAIDLNPYVYTWMYFNIKNLTYFTIFTKQWIFQIILNLDFIHKNTAAIVYFWNMYYHFAWRNNLRGGNSKRKLQITTCHPQPLPIILIGFVLQPLWDYAHTPFRNLPLINIKEMFIGYFDNWFSTQQKIWK